MNKLLVSLYDWFERHKVVFYTLMIGLILICGAGALRINFEENISTFFKISEDEDLQKNVFDNLKIKDKIVVSISGKDADTIIMAADIFVEELQPLVENGLVLSIQDGINPEQISGSADFIYDHLPMFLTDEDYVRIDSLLNDEAISSSVADAYSSLTSASGMVLKDFVLKDPLNIGTELLKKYQRFDTGLDYTIYADRVFSSDMNNMFLFIEPAMGMGDTGNNEYLVSALEDASDKIAGMNVDVDFIGGPVVAVYNARQIKKDTALTLSIALLILMAVIFFSFRNKWSIPLIILPTIFGTLFSLAIMGLFRDSMSAIALGAGTVVMGISMSYSIHVVSHGNYTNDPHRIIKEVAYPLTIGCLTTIGAFVALLFTNSGLLRDFGLFAALALVGTTSFALIFIPHFVVRMKDTKPGRLLKFIERCNTYSFENKKWLVLAVLAITVVCLFFYKDVEFDDDMNNINFMPDHLVESEQEIGKVLGDNSGKVFLVTSSVEIEQTSESYDILNNLCGRLEEEEKISDFINVGDFVYTSYEQQARIDKWNEFWDSRKDRVIASVQKNAVAEGFRKNAFSQFEEMLNKDYKICHYTPEDLENVDVLSDWISVSNEVPILISSITVEDEDKDYVYGEIEKAGNTTIIDRTYFSTKMVSSEKDDFNYILFISSLIVFVALLITYGRIELTLMTFLPMCISWVIILGIMAIFDIKFNIINIILATFIFGIGDDFSIFIMDGLLQDYRDKKKLLGIHKTAIFFSAFTTIVGMGALMFAKHPAIKSIAFISVLGMCVVIIVAYIVQPFLFKVLISSQTKKGDFPYTLGAILNTIYSFLYFFIGCLLAQLYIVIFAIIPIGRRRKKLLFHKLLYWFSKIFLSTMFTVKPVRENPYKEKFDRPAVIIANHQSFIDILMILSTTPKVLMVTNTWVWNSPFFGWIVRYADFYHSSDGYEHLAERLGQRVKEGYSIVVFPEGTRSVDCSIQRFHKGAFYLARLLKLDIVPVILYGNGLVSSKRQPFYIKHGLLVSRIMKRLPCGDESFGSTYQEQSKQYRKWFKTEYERLSDKYGRTYNHYFRDAIIKNYIYKGPVLEWYMRVKTRMDGYYDMWDRMIAGDAFITDVGCGYGQLSFMLGLLSKNRTVVGIDYDQSKIDLANNAFLKTDRIDFRCADMRICDLPESDVFLFNDSLHYVQASTQEKILDNCLKNLKENGMIIVKDGDASNKHHDATIKTEIWSTKLIKFNHNDEKLDFVGKEWMQSYADRNNLHLKIESIEKKTSETIYILTL